VALRGLGYMMRNPFTGNRHRQLRPRRRGTSATVR
jgi:hypothetical protein